ncbi:MAG: hypothetical protein NWE92_03710 [Candidatus Bathyarchaeota archaeon]|nr:hypothetical protein [Candidatus Bathyarchaeota archaeon]
MTIHFLFGRRESLQGKSEAYKKSVREYLEASGFSQTIDSSIQGSFPDMIFVNPSADPNRKFIVESKAELISLKSVKLAQELIKYVRLSDAIGPDTRFKLFAQGVKKPSEWDSVFSETNDFDKVKKWCFWYNESCLEKEEKPLDEVDFKRIQLFFARSEVIVGNVVDLQQAAQAMQCISNLSFPKMSEDLLSLAQRRTSPVSKKSKLVMNILPISVPEVYYIAKTNLVEKKQIYERFKDTVIPPFIFTKEKQIMSFAEFTNGNPLTSLVIGEVSTLKTSDFQHNNPSFSSELVNIHLRRIFWNRGLYRDPDADVLFYPMFDKTNERLDLIDHRGKPRWVVKKIVFKEDTKYHKSGDINFFFHRGVELRTPTYWNTSFVELIPRRYYTLDGENRTTGDIRAKIDRKFRNPNFDRSKTRLGLMRFWRHLLFESDFIKPPEEWFNKFQFGNFESVSVNWAPDVIDRNQMSLWDYKGE